MGILADSTTYKNQRWFHIFCPELLPFKQGDVTIDNTQHSVSIENVLTKTTESTTINGTTTIYAEYFGLDFSRDVPTMYRGMQVVVLNYANNDKYYWLPLERDDYLRTFEHYRISCLNLSKTNKAPLVGDDTEAKDATITDDNSYYLEIDTKYNKQIKISTANSDGEAFRYFIKINALEHVLEIWDECSDGSQLNNIIKMESRPGMNPDIKGRITMQTAGGSTIVLSSEDAHVKIPRNLTVDVGGDVAVQVKGAVAKVVEKDYDETIKGTRKLALTGDLIEVIGKNHKQTINKNKTVDVKYTHKDTCTTRIANNETTLWQSDKYILQVNENMTVTSKQTVFNLGNYTLQFDTAVVKGTSATATLNTTMFTSTMSSANVGELAFIFGKGFIHGIEGTITP